ncbi:MAG TPA: L-histidine N(alpha)-methyltransferase [Pyrinomonadaceae bacterium]|jgi:dimethylhistidine N-methyltransferase|nr:L-histidine N(alpha)-methyltransferase [Pyrinomonadaceae bacterium]
MPPTDGDPPHAARLRLHQLDTADARAAFARDVATGLRATPKQLFPKYFYDELGSELFDAICLLPEYYLTRAENEILSAFADEIITAATTDDSGGGSSSSTTTTTPLALLELGSGSATKTRRIIEALLKRQPTLLYLPVDISASALRASAHALLQSYPALQIEAYASDYDTALARLSGERAMRDDERLLALFLGSNIGNFDRDGAEQFLRALRGVLRAGDALLLGADLKKDQATLEAAYDDALGVTAAFNLNQLVRLNREFAADFKLRAFRHVAVYNEAEGRVEIYIESRFAQVVALPGLDMEITFAEGERIHTENSYKYDPEELDALAERTGFKCRRRWTDAAGRFSSNLFVAR